MESLFLNASRMVESAASHVDLRETNLAEDATRQPAGAGPHCPTFASFY